MKTAVPAIVSQLVRDANRLHRTSNLEKSFMLGYAATAIRDIHEIVVSAVSVPLGPLLSEHDWSCEKASRRIWKLNYG